MSTSADTVRRAGAVGALLAILIGMPLLLAVSVGWPLPASVPSWAELVELARSALPASTIIDVLAVGAWLAWAHFAVCVLAELRGELTGRRWHVPLGGPSRQLAHRLVVTALITSAVVSGTGLTAARASVVLPTSAASSASTANLGAVVPTVAMRLAGAQTTSGPASSRLVSAAPTGAAAEQDPAVASELRYVVQAPHGGRADFLWDIAEQHLGDGARWREIYALNHHELQPDGDRLTNPDLIRPGWQLRMPADAVGLTAQAGPAATAAATTQAAPEQARGLYTVAPGDTLRSIAQARLGDESRAMELYGANRDRLQPDGQRLVDADLIRPGWQLQMPPDQLSAQEAPPAAAPAPAPSTAPAPPPAPVVPPVAEQVPEAKQAVPVRPAVPAPPASKPEPVRPPQDNAPAKVEQPPPVMPDTGEAGTDDEVITDGVWVRTAEGIGALLAAFLLVLLARRRTAQRAGRRAGQRIPMPTGTAEATELELRAVEDPIAIVELDLALRRLAATQRQAGAELPQVRAARLTADTIELYPTGPAMSPPAPWRSEAGSGMWTVRRDQLRTAPAGPDPDGLPAPYPALVTLGQDEESGHVLVDLEQISSLGVTGTPEASRAVLVAIALELATSSWAREVDLTLVGLCPELPGALPERPGRLSYTEDLSVLLAELERHADELRAGLDQAGVDSPLTARGAGTVPDSWAPQVVLLADTVPPVLRDRLERVLSRLPRVGVAAVTGSGAPLGAWALQVDAGGQAVLLPAGLTIKVQQVPAGQYADVLAQLDTSLQPVVPGPAWSTGLASRQVRPADLPEQALLDSPSSRTVAGAEPGAERTAAELAIVDELPRAPVPARADAVVLDAQGPVIDELSVDQAHHVHAENLHLPEGATSPAEPAAPATVEIDLTDPDRTAAATADDAVAPPGAGGDRLRVLSTPEVEQLLVPRVRVLGDLAVLGARGEMPIAVKDGRTVANTTPRCTALIAYLALNPGAVSWDVLAEKLSPGRVWKASTARNVTTKARTWLGADEDGHFLPRFADSGSYRLRPDVRTDWHDWLDLIGPDVTSTPTDRLDQALALVQGAPFSNITSVPNYYAWAEPIRMEIISSVVDVTHEIISRVLLSRDQPGEHDLPASAKSRAALARRALRIGRLVDPGSELVYRDAMLLEHRTGNSQAVRKLAHQVLQQAEDLESSLEPETEQLLSDLQALAR